jgi:hypothetical protein
MARSKRPRAGTSAAAGRDDFGEAELVGFPGYSPIASTSRLPKSARFAGRAG